MSHAIIFDLDGTLTDSEPAHEMALRKAVEQWGMTFTTDFFRNHCIGQGDAQCAHKIARLYNTTFTDAQVQQIISRKNDAFLLRECLQRIALQPGAMDCLKHASTLCSIGLCSGSNRQAVMATIERVSLADRFQSIVTASDVKHNKPAPESYLLAAQHLEIDPGHVLAVEDTPTGAMAAKAAGCVVVAVGHSLTKDAFDAIDHFVPSIADLTPDLQNMLMAISQRSA